MLPESAGSVVVVVLPKDGSASSSAASRVPETVGDGSGVVTEGMTALKSCTRPSCSGRSSERGAACWQSSMEMRGSSWEMPILGSVIARRRRGAAAGAGAGFSATSPTEGTTTRCPPAGAAGAPGVERSMGGTATVAPVNGRWPSRTVTSGSSVGWGTTGTAGTAGTTGFEADVPASEEAGSDAMAGMSANIAETALSEGDGN